MNARSSAYQGRSSPVRPILFAATAIVLSIGATVGVLASAGVLDLPFLRKAAAAARPKPQPSGVPVILAARPIPAFTRITRDHILDAQTLDVVVTYMRAEDVAKNGFLGFEQINGRVLANDKPAGFAFRETDFLPPGTRPGVVAGIPAGKRSFVVNTEQVVGLHNLRIGDRIDLLGTLVTDKETHDKLPRAGKANQPGAAKARSGVKALVQNAVVVLPVTTRQVPVTSAPIGKDGKPQTKPLEEVTIAIDPAEVAPLSHALALNAEVYCVAHSGLPNEPPGTTPGLNPPPKGHTMESIVGSKREVITFPATGGPPETQPVGEAPKDKAAPEKTPPITDKP